jgi:DNA mismatch repair protein MutS2
MRAENASMQFDLATLKPTFRLLIGTPGSSNALAVARKLGMLPAIIDKAQLLLAQGEDGASELINQVQATRAAAEEKRTRAQALLQAVKAIHLVASERLERTEQERTDLMNQADLAIDKSMRQVRDLLHEYVADLSHAPKPWCERFEELSRRIDQAITNTPLALHQAQFIETIRKGDTVYVMPFRREGVVLRLRHKKKTIILQMNGKQIEVPFTEIWPVDKFHSK